jgi:hypothetical protein
MSDGNAASRLRGNLVVKKANDRQMKSPSQTLPLWPGPCTPNVKQPGINFTPAHSGRRRNQSMKNPRPHLRTTGAKFVQQDSASLFYLVSFRSERQPDDIHKSKALRFISVAESSRYRAGKLWGAISYRNGPVPWGWATSGPGVAHLLQMKSPSHWRPGLSLFAMHAAYSGRRRSGRRCRQLEHEFGEPKAIPSDGHGYRKAQAANQQSASYR